MAHVATVFLEGWQVEKWQAEHGGKPPFEIGSEVDWALFPLPAKQRASLSVPLGPDVGDSITHLEAQQPSAADSQPVPTRGRITFILATYWKLEDGHENMLVPAPGTAAFQERQHLNAWDEWESEGIADHRFGGFIVYLAVPD